jgi:hypothetical protein
LPIKPTRSDSQFDADTEPTVEQEAQGMELRLITAAEMETFKTFVTYLEGKHQCQNCDLIWASYNGHYAIVALILLTQHDKVDINYQEV